MIKLMNYENIQVLVAGEADASLVADLSRKTFYDSFVSFNTQANMNKFMEEQFSREKLMAEVRRTDHIFLLAYSYGEPLGYACLRESENPDGLENVRTIEIARIYALQQIIGKGVGAALMQRCINIGKEKNKQVIWLGVWEGNQKAISFYVKWGFQRFGEHIFMLGDDAQTDWLMKKNLE